MATTSIAMELERKRRNVSDYPEIIPIRHVVFPTAGFVNREDPQSSTAERAYDKVVILDAAARRRAMRKSRVLCFPAFSGDSSAA